MKSVEQISLTITKNIYGLNYLSFQDDVYDRLQQQKYLDAVLKEFIYSNAIVHSMELYLERAQFPSIQGQVRYYDLSEAIDNPGLQC